MKRNNSAYRLVAFGLALLVLMTSVGWVVDMHYCAGQLKSVNWLGKAKSCHQKAQAKPEKRCPHHQKMMMDEGYSSGEKKCCKNKTFYFHADQDTDIPASEFMMEKQAQHFLLAYFIAFGPSLTIERDIPAYTHYRPPLISRDIPVLVQSFLL